MTRKKNPPPSRARVYPHAPLCEQCLRPGAYKGRDGRMLHLSCRLELKKKEKT